LSTPLTDHLTAARPLSRAARPWRAGRLPLPRLAVRSTLPREADESVELGFRFAAVQVGYWLGWASIIVVLVGLALDVGAQHRSLLVGATLAAAAGNTVARPAAAGVCSISGAEG
jgi:hypothetical protein